MEDNSKQIAKPPPKITGNEGVDGIALRKITRVAEDIALMDQGTVRIREASSTRKNKPPTLNPEAMRSLLENRLQMILSEEADDPNFLKCLLVSKRFLNTTRRYPIFCFGIHYQPENAYFGFTDLLIFKRPPMRKGFKGAKEIVLSYQKVNSLLSMLKPNHAIMSLVGKTSNETITKAIGHLKLIPGKIGLVLGDNVGFLLDQFSRRKIEFLSCSPELLARSDFTLKLGYYLANHPVNNGDFSLLSSNSGIFSSLPVNNGNFSLLVNNIGHIPSLPVNNGQLRKVLSHELDYLECKIDGHFMDEAQVLPSLSSDHCTSLKWLHVTCNQHYDSLMDFLDVVKDKCTNLQTIDVVIALGDGETLHVSNADEILDQILIAQGKIQQIIEKCCPLVQHLKLSSCVAIWYDYAEEFPRDEWIGRAKSLDCFKEATYEETFCPGEDVSLNICQLHSKFNDGFLIIQLVFTILVNSE